VSLKNWLPELSLPHAAFSVAALVILVALWFLTSRIIQSRMLSRLERIEGLEHFEAVPTSTPYNEPQVRARHTARTNVRTRYTVMRNMLAVVAVIVAILLAVLPILGTIPRAFLSFLVAVVLAIVGVAARPLVENLFSGVVISLSIQLRIGVTVLLDGDYYGTIEDINITQTVVKLWDWRRYIVPNSNMLQKEVISYTTKDTYLWAYVAFQVSSRADLALVERLAEQAAARSSFNAGFELPQFWVRDLSPGYVTCWIAAWAKNPEDAWA
jgi:small-conductance mechanosensitive channel